MSSYKHELSTLATSMTGELKQRFLAFAGAIELGLWHEATDLYHSFWNAGLRGDAYSIMQQTLNPVLRNHERELTTHGIMRSFRFWTADEKKVYLEQALLAVDMMKDKITPNVSLCFGTALAIARSNDLIPHDDDIDTLVLLPKADFPTYQAATSHVLSHFPKSEFEVHQVQPFLMHVYSPKSKTKFDIFVGLDEGGYASVFPGPRREILVDDMFPTRSLDLFGVPVPVPGRLETYLAKVYGASWRVPDPQFSHNWDRSAHADLFE